MKKTTFSNRIRFNWGYHDAALAVREGWDNVERNYGFAKHGPLAGLYVVVWDCSNIMEKHPDKAYARGWLFGYRDAKAGTYKENSNKAWTEAVADGKVTK